MIKKLPEDVIIKIAAGQVVQRPMNGLKELIQNSIDAQSTALHILIHDGGMSRLQIADNGKGIHPDDYPLLCQRFATSKLKSYEDLQSIGSFGFRGEALASLSFVGNVEVISRIKQNNLAYQAKFKDGKLIGTLTPTTRNIGTTIKVTNLFSNLQTRRKSLSANQQKRKIIKLINNIALHYSNIRFQLQTEKGVERKIDCLQDPIQNKMRVFSQIFSLQKSSIFFSETILDSTHIKGLFSKLSTSKSKILILFINNRLVQYPDIEKAIEKAYSACYNSIHQHLETFNVYLSIEVDQKIVDCNMHPTKKEVRIVGGHRIGEDIIKWVSQILKSNYKIKTIGKIQPISFGVKINQRKQQLGYDKIRTQASQLPLKFFFQKPNQNISSQIVTKQKPYSHNQTNQIQIPIIDSIKIEANQTKTKTFGLYQPIQQLKPTNFPITIQKNNLDQLLIGSKILSESNQKVSFILNLSQTVFDTQGALQTKQFIKDFTYVGCYNSNYIFIQYKHSLMFLNLIPFLYPTLINFLKKTEILYMQLVNKISLCQLFQNLKSKKQLQFEIKDFVQVLINNRQIIKERLKILINESGEIISMCYPASCLKGKYNQIDLGYFFARLGKLLYFTSELDQQVAEDYLICYFITLFESQQQITGVQQQEVNQFFQTKILPLMKTKTSFHEIQINRYITKVVELKDLYSIFERC